MQQSTIACNCDVEPSRWTRWHGDTAKLRQAFHPEARMAGYLAGHHDDNGLMAEFIERIDANPGLAGRNIQAVIRIIDLTADAGVVVLAGSD